MAFLLSSVSTTRHPCCPTRRSSSWAAGPSVSTSPRYSSRATRLSGSRLSKSRSRTPRPRTRSAWASALGCSNASATCRAC
eukprot:scaffold85340_cov69-Phaeocystis_antarctica.AAC.3